MKRILLRTCVSIAALHIGLAGGGTARAWQSPPPQPVEITGLFIYDKDKTKGIDPPRRSLMKAGWYIAGSEDLQWLNYRERQPTIRARLTARWDEPTLRSILASNSWSNIEFSNTNQAPHLIQAIFTYPGSPPVQCPRPDVPTHCPRCNSPNDADILCLGAMPALGVAGGTAPPAGSQQPTAQTPGLVGYSPQPVAPPSTMAQGPAGPPVFGPAVGLAPKSGDFPWPPQPVYTYIGPPGVEPVVTTMLPPPRYTFFWPPRLPTTLDPLPGPLRRWELSPTPAAAPATGAIPASGSATSTNTAPLTPSPNP
jgi:hypothetical protein